MHSDRKRLARHVHGVGVRAGAARPARVTPRRFIAWQSAPFFVLLLVAAAWPKCAAHLWLEAVRDVAEAAAGIALLAMRAQLASAENQAALRCVLDAWSQCHADAKLTR